MASFVPTPEWFYGIDSAFGVISVLISLLISYYGFRLYSYSKEKRYFYFALAFLFIGLSLIIGALTNFLLYFVWMKHSPLYIKAHNFMLYYKIGFLTHFFFHLSAYMMLIMLCLKLKDRRVISLLFLFVVLSLVIAQKNFVSFYVISFVLMLIYIVPYFYSNYTRNKNVNTKMVFLAFSAIALSQLCFLLSVYSDKAYALGHISQLAGFVTLLVNFVLVFRR